MVNTPFIFWTFLISINFFSLFVNANFIEQYTDSIIINEEEGRQRIEAFRNFRYNGDYSLKFNLIHIPRRGSQENQEIYYGTLWGSWNSEGPVTRLELKPYNAGKFIRLIVQNGSKPKIWRLEEGGTIHELNKEEWFKPLFKNIVYTPFDLSLSFLFWNDFSYQGPKRVKNRPAQLFLMKPSADFAQSNPKLAGVFMAMDSSYNFLLQADLLNREGYPIQSIKLNNFQKVGDEYVIKQMDVVDELTHDKTRFEANAALLGLSIDPNYFTKESLNSANPDISIKHYHHLN